MEAAPTAPVLHRKATARVTQADRAAAFRERVAQLVTGEASRSVRAALALFVADKDAAALVARLDASFHASPRRQQLFEAIALVIPSSEADAYERHWRAIDEKSPPTKSPSSSLTLDEGGLLLLDTLDSEELAELQREGAKQLTAILAQHQKEETMC